MLPARSPMRDVCKALWSTEANCVTSAHIHAHNKSLHFVIGAIPLRSVF
jgi:hypothetical protein